MNRRTKEVDISPNVKQAVYDRDGGRCILCGQSGAPNAHYRSRAQNGLGIEQNIVTLCWTCHMETDQSTKRQDNLQEIRAYLDLWYPNFDDNKRFYRKDFWYDEFK